MGLFELFGPSWNSKNAEKRMAAVATIKTDRPYPLDRIGLCEKEFFSTHTISIFSKLAEVEYYRVTQPLFSGAKTVLCNGK